MASGITTSVGVLSTNKPAVIGDLWLPQAIPLHDWGKALVISSRFETTIEESHEGDEHRIGKRIRPTRTQIMSASAFDQNDLSMLKVLQRRASQARTLVPLMADETTLTAFDNANVDITDPGSYIYTVNTDDLRLFVGGRVIVCSPSNDNAIICRKFVVAKITAITSTTITLDTEMGERGGDVELGRTGRMFPAMEVEIELSERGKGITDSIETIKISSTETTAQTTLPGMQAVNTFDSGRFLSFGNLPVLDRLPDWVKLRTGQKRIGTRKKLGIGVVFDANADRTRETFEMSFTLGPGNAGDARPRQEASDFIRFFEGRAGKLFPFYLVHPSRRFSSLSPHATLNRLIISPGWDFNDWDQYSFIAAKRNDGTLELFTIITVVDLGNGIHEVQVLESVTSLRAYFIANPKVELDIVTTAHLVRFDQDELKETWLTNSSMQTKLKMIEILKNRNLSLTLESISGPASGPAWCPDPFGDDLCQDDEVVGAECTVCKLRPLELILTRWLTRCPECFANTLDITSSRIFTNPVHTTPGGVNTMTWTNIEISLVLDMDTTGDQWTILGVTQGEDYGCRAVFSDCDSVDPFNTCVECGCEQSTGCQCDTPNPGPIHDCVSHIQYCCGCGGWRKMLEIRVDPNFHFDACFP